MASRIPNWLIVWLIVLYFVAAILSQVDPQTIAERTILGVVAMIGAFGLTLAGVPGGIAKLYAVACLWLGLAGLFEFFIFSWIPMGIVGLAIIAIGKTGRDGIPFLPFAVFAAVIVAPRHVDWLAIA